jgi:hypothetical protein
MNGNQSLDSKQKRLLQEIFKLSTCKTELALVNDSNFGLQDPSFDQTDSSSHSKKKNGEIKSNIDNSKRKTNTSESNKKKDSSDYHFSGSAFLNSPDASQLPLPNFDDELSEPVLSKSVEKTEFLRQFLKIRPQAA